MRGFRRPRAAINRRKSSELLVYKTSACFAAMIATWASQISKEAALPHNLPISRARGSKEAISQKSSARDNKACPDVPRHTWARTVLGTRMSAPLRADTFRTLQRPRSFLSRAIGARGEYDAAHVLRRRCDRAAALSSAADNSPCLLSQSPITSRSPWDRSFRFSASAIQEDVGSLPAALRIARTRILSRETAIRALLIAQYYPSRIVRGQEFTAT